MRQKARLVSALLLALAAASPLAAPHAALAKEPSASELAAVKELLKDAISEEKAGKCTDALAILKQAAAIKETAEVLYHQGECQVKMGRLRDGLTSLEKSLDAARQSRERAVMSGAPPKIEQVKARIPTLTLRVPSDAKGVAVRIDDEVIPADRLGSPIQLDPGEHTINVTADGRKPFSQKVTLAEKDAQDLPVDISPVGQTSTPPVEGPKAKHDDATGSDSDKSNRIPLGTWIAGSAAVALTIGGIVAFAAAGSAASDGEAQCAKQSKCDQSAIDSVHQLDTAALLLWVGAAAGAGAAIAFYVLDKPRGRVHAPPPTSGQRLGPASARVVVGPGSLRLIGTF